MAIPTELSWLRRNIALIIALFSLIATSAGGFASYRLLEWKVAELEVISAQRAERNAQAIKETRVVLDVHLQQSGAHMDAQKWQLLMDRLAVIERKLDSIR